MSLAKTYTASEVAQLVEQERLRAVAGAYGIAIEAAADECDGAQEDSYIGKRNGFTPEQTMTWNRWATGLGDRILALKPPPDAQKWLEEHDSELLAAFTNNAKQIEALLVFDAKASAREDCAQRLDALTKGWDGECCKAFDCGDESCGTLRACANEVREIAAAIRSHTLPGGEK